jgi:hypothetical protein
LFSWFCSIGFFLPFFKCSTYSSYAKRFIYLLRFFMIEQRLHLIYKSEFHTNFNISQHIDLPPFTFFLETGYACLLHFLGKFIPKHNQSLFETLPKLVSRHTWLTNYKKKQCKKNNLRNHISQKRGGGNRRDMIMITDSMVF